MSSGKQQASGHGLVQLGRLSCMAATMTIGEAARRAAVNPRTLRYYERIGLLAPSMRSAAGYRLYTAADLTRLAFIRRAQRLGLSLGEIAAVLAVHDAGAAPCRHVRALAQAKVSEIETHLDELRALRQELMDLAERALAVEPACAAGSAICLAFDREERVAP
jgi:MerR family transcriptional regulator, copper efflux regulator